MTHTPGKRTRSRFSGLLARLALLAASLVACFLLLEIVFRVIVPSNPPGTTYGKAVAKSTFGFRDRDLEVPKPEGTYRIVMLGDSFAWGVGLDVEQALPEVLETMLAASVTSGTIEVVNAAEPGFNTVEELNLLSERRAVLEPDMVVLIYNLNDIEYLPELSERTYESEPTPVVELDPGEDVTKYSRNAGFRGFVLALERRSMLVRFMVPRMGALLRRLGLIESVEFSWVEKIYQGFSDDNPGWLESKRALSEIAGLCRESGCRFLVAVYPLFADLESYKGRGAHQKVLEFCREQGIEAVDLLPIFENTPTRSHWINFMDSHPNAAAHRAVAERLLPVVRERLPDRYSAP
jgi:lysophospholipase L1-like esterase